MSAQEMPEWFKEEILVFLRQKGYSENDWSHDGITDGMVHAFKLLSIPTNAAKIPEVAKLVEAAKPCFSDLQKVLSCTEDEICKACKLEEALAPFKGGE